MPTGGKKIVVTYPDGSAETYTVATGDIATITEGDILSFKGTLSGDSAAKKWAIKGFKKYSIEDT